VHRNLPEDHRHTHLVLMLTLTFSTGVVGTHPVAGVAVAGRRRTAQKN
jgi:hypothetical protein